MVTTKLLCICMYIGMPTCVVLVIIPVSTFGGTRLASSRDRLLGHVTGHSLGDDMYVMPLGSRDCWTLPLLSLGEWFDVAPPYVVVGRGPKPPKVCTCIL